MNTPTPSNRPKPPKKPFRLTLFYKRKHEPSFASLGAALAHIESRRLNRSGESYAQLWHMTSETDGEMVAFFENDSPADLALQDLTKQQAKLRK